MAVVPRLPRLEAPGKYFPLGGPVPAEDLVGRERYIQASVERLLDGQNLLVAGPRRIGKTSVMFEVLRRLRKKGAYTAYVDVLGATSLHGLGERLADSLLQQQTGLARSMEHAKAVASGAKLTAKVRYEHLELAIELAREQNELKFFEAALDLSQALASRAKRRVVVTFDEFQGASRWHARIFDIIRARLQPHRAVR